MPKNFHCMLGSFVAIKKLFNQSRLNKTYFSHIMLFAHRAFNKNKLQNDDLIFDEEVAD